MSTSLNDVVFEVYRDLTAQEQERRLTYIQKFFRSPMKIFNWLKVRAKALSCEYGRRNFFRLTYGGEPNVFQATDKVFPDTKIAVYTVITGGYDEPKLPIYIDDTLDYYLFTDSGKTQENLPENFRALPIPEKLNSLSNAKKNRYMKLHPDEFITESITGKKYDYTIYIDGRTRITCDIKPLVYSLIDSGKTIAIHDHFMRDDIYEEGQMMWIRGKVDRKGTRKQLNVYKDEGMPKHFGLLENTVLIRKCNAPQIQDIMHQWWLQIEKFTHRDQLSLPYVLWKNGLDTSWVFSLGTNVWKNPYFMHYGHN